MGFIASVAFVTGIASGFMARTSTTSLSEEVISGEGVDAKIGILRLEGIILTSGSDGGLTTGGIITASQVKRWFREIAADNQLKALILEVNSPGGSPVASDEIYRAIQTLRLTGKTVIVVMEDTAASGAYFFSVAADKIIASPATLTGSIGVIAEIPNLEELLKNLGVDIEIYKSGKFKDSTSFSRSRTEEEKAMIQEYVDTAYDLFVSRVVEGRKLEEERVRELSQGQIYSGIKAKELGLIDKLGSVEDGIEEAKTLQNLQDVQIVRYRTESALDILLGRIGTLLNPLNSLLVKFVSPGMRAAYLPSY